MKQEDIRYLVCSNDGGIRIGDTLYLLINFYDKDRCFDGIERCTVLHYSRLHPSSIDVGDYYNVTCLLEGDISYVDLDDDRVLFASKSEDEVRDMLFK